MLKKSLIMLSLVSSLVMASKEEFVGSGKGYNGDIKVKVSVENKKITDIEVVKHEESGFTRRAMKKINDEILSSQSLDVDNIAGATYTSEGIKEAVGKAIASSGVILNKVAKKATINEELKDLETDIVVVGGGGAGLSAAIAAKENGARVILLEKMPMVGGNTMKGGKNLNNPSLLKKLTEESKYAIDWLISKGTDLTEVSFSGGQSVKRIHRPTGGKAVGPVIVDALNSTLENMGVETKTNNRVVKILMENNKVSGVLVENNGKEYKINAKAIIMATGGFGANADMVSEYNPNLKGFGTTNNPAITGEGIKLIQEVGGDVVDMKQIQTHPTVVHQTPNMITESVRGEGAILVNRDGKRFINELETRDVVSKAELEQKGKSAFLIFDQQTRESLSAINGYVKKGLTKEANNISELSKIIGVDSKELEKTITKYNSFVKNGKDSDFGKKGLPREIVKAPFYAIEVSPAIHHTMGGVNENAEVLDKNGDKIQGLYAAGEITGGVHGGNRIGGNAVTDIIVFGKIAGENAAKEVKK